MPQYHLAQLNIAKMKGDMDNPVMKDFVDNLEGVNSLADNSPGFVWRLETEEDRATNLRVFDDNMLLVNMSVWESIDDLKIFVYESFHLEILKRKKEWFDKFDGVYQVMWWIRSGTIPEEEEAKARLSYLQKHGESELAFNFRKSFSPSEKYLVFPKG
ncbi:MAG: hypothetical protein ACI9SC_001359 [Gammaproteobacteria bacterium]|jgi:hypothetical protein